MQFRHLLALILFAFLSAIAAGANSQTIVAGSSSGQFSVSESGAATYRIPIQVPPGVAGMEPKLELVYNSQSGNGVLGMGWSLGGLSAITRCPRTMAQDGARGSVIYDSGDRYCMDGQRLLVVSGTYGAAGSEYRTELESFSKITAYGIAGNGPAYFIVKTKAGLTIEYGNTTDSRVEAQGKTTVRAWAVNRIGDVKANYLTVSYIEDGLNGDFYPSRIDYTGNSTTGASTSNSVQFVPASRPDVAPIYQAGSLMKFTKRFSAIETYVGSVLVKKLKLTYRQGYSTNVSMVASIQECNDVGQCLGAVSLTTSDGSGSDMFTALAEHNFGDGTAVNNPWILADVTGDGCTDLIYPFAGSGTARVRVKRSNCDGTFTAIAEQNFGDGASVNNPWIVADIDGDGCTDMVYPLAGSGTARVRAKRSNCDGTFTALAEQDFGDGTSVDNPWIVADVNGDGCSDLIYPLNGSGTARVRVKRSNCDGTFTALAEQNFGDGTSVANPWIIADVNGDGCSDLIYPLNGSGTARVRVKRSNCDGTFAALAEQNFGDGTSVDNPWIIADVNGDGCTDLIYPLSGSGGARVRVKLSNCDGTFTALAEQIFGDGTSVDNPWIIADINWDGCADLLYPFNSGDGARLRVKRSNCDGTFTAVWPEQYFGDGTAVNNPWVIADVDGDGRVDLLYPYKAADGSARVRVKARRFQVRSATLDLMN